MMQLDDVVDATHTDPERFEEARHREFNFCAELRVFLSKGRFLLEIVVIYSYILVHQI